MGLVVLGHHEKAGGAAIEAVDDAGTEDAPHSGQVAHVAEQRVHQRPPGRSRARVDDESGRLVHDDEVRVLVDDGDRDVLRQWLGRDRGGHVDDGHLPGAKAGRGSGTGAVEPHVSLGDQRLESGPGEGGQPSGQPRVEPLAVGLLVGDELVPLGHPEGVPSAGSRGVLRVCGFLVARHDRSSSE